MVVEVQAQHRLALQVEEAPILQRYIDTRATVEDCLVEDRDGTHGIVDRVVHILHERRSASRHTHRPWGHIHRSERDLPAICRLVLTSQDKLIALSDLLRCDHRRVVDLSIDVALGNGGVTYLLSQVATKRFRRGKDDEPTLRIDRKAWNKVKYTIRVWFIACIQTVHTQDSREKLPRYLALINIRYSGARAIIAVEDIELEVLRLEIVDAAPEAVDVAHHKPPVRSRRGHRCALEQLDKKVVSRTIRAVRAKLPHLIDLALISVLKGDAHHLIWLETHLQRERTELVVDVVLISIQTACTLYLRIVYTTTQLPLQ